MGRWVSTENWTRESLAWVAGILEGEGCFGRSLNKKDQSWSYRITCDMTDEDVIRRLHSVLGAGTVQGPYWRSNSTKPIWRFAIQNWPGCYAVSAAVFPLMGDRRRERIRDMLAPKMGWNKGFV